MLTISNEQIRQLDAARRERFLRRLADALAADFPAETEELASEDLDTVVAILVNKAESLGIESEDSVFAYAAMGVCFGIDFHEHPAVDRLLFAGDTPADEAMRDVPFLLSADDLAEIRRDATRPAAVLQEVRARLDAALAAEDDAS
jgi:hypothetical protein